MGHFMRMKQSPDRSICRVTIQLSDIEIFSYALW